MVDSAGQQRDGALPATRRSFHSFSNSSHASGNHKLSTAHFPQQCQETWAEVGLNRPGAETKNVCEPWTMGRGKILWKMLDIFNSRKSPLSFSDQLGNSLHKWAANSNNTDWKLRFPTHSSGRDLESNTQSTLKHSALPCSHTGGFSATVPRIHLTAMATKQNHPSWLPFPKSSNAFISIPPFPSDFN